MGLAVLGMALQGAALAADAGPFVFPELRTPAAVTARCEATLKAMAAAEKAAETEGSVAVSVLASFDRITQIAEDGLAPVSFLGYVHPDKPIREAAQACDLKQQAFGSKLLQNRRILARLQALQPADAIETRLRDDLLASFEDAGANLPPAARDRARRLNTEIGKLSQTFERRVQEDKTQLAFTEAELDGVNPNVWSKAKRDAQGRVLLGLDYPTYNPVRDTARNPKTRERMYRAFHLRGGQANLATLASVTQKRREYARLFGLPSYADFAVRRRMAGSVEKVQAFLGEVGAVAAKRELTDLADLRAAKAAELSVGSPDAVRIERWDQTYYTERVKQQRFALDQERFRRHFPPQASVDFVMALSTQLFGVGFKPIEQTLWHADAKAYAVTDAATGATIATLYLDLYPRADKFSHAACWPLRGSSTLTGRLPTAALVTNFDRNGLTLDELETLLHEFGHALHQTLSTTRYANNAGTSVKLDFVEAPSQMLEEWVYDARTLALFQQVCAECEPVPADLLERAQRSRSFAKGILEARQHLYASYDLALHTAAAPEPMATWAKLEGATPMGYVKGTMLPAGFAHLVGGYGAGYYAYLWSKATAHDLYTAFAADPLSATVGRRYRETVLSNGGQVDPNELVKRVLGRPQNNEAFFKWLNE
jgi:thimet oligopeptidase